MLNGLGIDNNLYVQIGLILLIALSAKNAILIVEVAREMRAAGKPIVEAAVEAARARFRPILMTSFAFILGVAPLVVATGAGASARKSIGITVFSGMIASTCLAVLFVPSLLRGPAALRGMASRAQEEAGGHIHASRLGTAKSPRRPGRTTFYRRISFATSIREI